MSCQTTINNQKAVGTHLKRYENFVKRAERCFEFPFSVRQEKNYRNGEWFSTI